MEYLYLGLIIIATIGAFRMGHKCGSGIVLDKWCKLTSELEQEHKDKRWQYRPISELAKQCGIKVWMEKQKANALSE